MLSDIKITTTISRELLEGIFASALEGGSNYWAYITDEQWDIVDEQSKYAIYLNGGEEKMLFTILDIEVDIEIDCAENNDKVLGTLSAKTFKKRLKSLSDHNNYSRFLYAELNGEGDAESSDVIFQYLVLGEVIYG